MFDHLRQSLEQTLHDRIKSPFAGAFILSWLTWNWRIPYYIFFSENSLSIYKKIEHIENELLHVDKGLIYPLISTIVLVLFYPLITTGAIWVTLRYKKLQNHIEGLFPITPEEAREIRKENADLKKEFGESLQGYASEIKILKEENESLRTALTNQSVEDVVSENKKEGTTLVEMVNFDKLLSKRTLLSLLPEIIKNITNEYSMNGMDARVIVLLEGEGIIEQTSPNFYKWTNKGKRFIAYHLSKDME